MIIRRKELELVLSKTAPHSNPRVELEQYTTPAPLAADLLHTAAYTFRDIVGRRVVDLGCGTGRLAVGAAHLGAEYVVGIDRDPAAIAVAQGNAERAGVRVEWVVGDIALLRGRFDTALENPPFGVWRRGADLEFLRKALNMANVIYSIHKTGTENRKVINEAVEETGGHVTNVFMAEMTIPYMFDFHRKPVRKVQVDIYRINSREP